MRIHSLSVEQALASLNTSAAGLISSEVARRLAEFGLARAVVYATGMRTEFGRTAHLTQTAGESTSPLQRETVRLSIRQRADQQRQLVAGRHLRSSDVSARRVAQGLVAAKREGLIDA